MDVTEIIKQAKRICESRRSESSAGMVAEAREFLRVYGGDQSAFLKTLDDIQPLKYQDEPMRKYVVSTLEAFIRYAENGLLTGISIERKAQIDVVSDFLDQANALLQIKDVHPSAPAVIVGAALEEFLRNWIEEKQLDLQGKKPGIDAYAKTLREAEKITKQDFKDITSWAGLRNHAAHGEWDEVGDKQRVELMLAGVNLFMRQYGQ